MSKATIFFIGAVVGICLPLLMDLVLFGTLMPCETVKTFEDGSSIQNCSVRG